MKSPQVSPLAQIEWAIGDLERPSEILAALFGASPIEEQLSTRHQGARQSTNRP